MASHRPVAVRLADEHHELIRDIAAALKRDPSVAERIRAVLYTATSEDAVNRPFTPLPDRALALVEDLPEAEPDAVTPSGSSSLRMRLHSWHRPLLPSVR